MVEKFCTKAEIAMEVGLPVHVLTYWLNKWGVGESKRFAGVKVYDPQRADEIRGLVASARAANSFSMKCPALKSTKQD